MQILSKKSITLFIFLFINFIFTVKYLSRITNFYLILAIVATYIYFSVWKNRNFITQKIKPSNRIIICILFLFIISSIIILKIIPAEKLNVDRWSVITSFWDNYFKFKYVYFAKSHLGNPPGPMPFYFILALPFYLFGELGYFSIFGCILFLLLLKYSKVSIQFQTILMLLFVTSVFFLWEVICRSNIFLNGVLIVAVINKFFQIKYFNVKNCLSIGILIGLSISTRNVFIIPYIIVFIFSLNKKVLSLKQTTIIGTVTILIFALSFLPFVWNHVADFKLMNPFLIQSSALMPFKLTIPFILFGALTGFACKSKSDVYYFSSLTLFILILGYFIYHFITDGFHNAFFGSTADISYFILCIPFSLFFLIQKTN